jgi:pimeloyl-ACP methyl ester carboxylesterase
MIRALRYSACTAALLAAGCAYTVNDTWFFKPLPIVKKAASVAELKLDHEERLTIRLPDGKLPAGYMPTLVGRLPARVTHEFVDLGGEKIAVTRIKSTNGADDEPLIAACMGEAGIRYASGDYYAEKLLPWGEVLLFDYPGYGDSTGKPTIDAMLALQKDLPAYLDGLARNRPLVIWGHSLGGPICAAIAGFSKQADAVVLETSAANFADIMQAKKPWFTPPFLKLELEEKLKTYDVANALAKFTGPIMVIGAGKDEILPVQLSRIVADQLKAEGRDVAYLEVPFAAHMNAAMNSQFAKDAWPFFQTLSDIRH